MTQLKPEELDLLARSNQTFAIVGKLGKGKEVALLSNLKEDKDVRDGRVTVDEFFKVIEPGLFAEYGKLTAYGQFVLNTYDLRTPLEFEKRPQNGAWQPIGAASELLDASSVLAKVTTRLAAPNNEYHEIQKIGLELFQDTLKHLDTISHYSHSKFFEAILVVAKSFVAQRAPEVGKEMEHRVKLSAANWVTLLEDDPILGATIVNYLLSFPDDEAISSTHLHKMLQLDFEGEQVIIIDAIVKSLADLKGLMQSGSSQGQGEGAWAIMANGQEFLDSRWLDDFAKSKFCVSGPRNRGTFLAHCQEFLSAKHSVQGFLRSAALHPFFVCGLASKYAKYGSLADTMGVGAAIFEKGVESVVGRNFGESVAQQGEAAEAIRRENIDIESTNTDLGVNYKDLNRIQTQTQLLEIRQDRVFDIESLLEVGKRVFGSLGQLAGGGKMAEIVEAISSRRRQRFAYRNEVLGLISRLRKGESLDVSAELRKRAAASSDERAAASSDERATASSDERATASSDEREFVESILELADKDNPESLRLAFYRAWTRASANEFASAYRENKDEIERNKRALDNAYVEKMARLGVWDKDRGPGTRATAELPIRSGASPGDKEATQNRRKTRLNRHAREMEIHDDQVSQSKPRIQRPLPAEFLKGNEKALLSGEVLKGSIKNGDRDIATVRIDRAGAEIQLNVSASKHSFEDLDGGVLVVNDRTYKDAFKGTIPSIDEIKSVVALDTIAKWSGDLIATEDSIHARYSDGEADKTSRVFKQMTRSWHGIEELASANPTMTNIGRPDLSIPLGLFVQAIQYFDFRSTRQFTNEPDSDTSEQIATSLDWSRLIPVSDENGPQELGTYIQSQYDLARGLIAVAPFLKELREIRSTIESIEGCSIRIVIVNQSAGAYAASTDAKTAPMHLCARHAPLFVYLTAQADAQGGISAFVERIRECLRIAEDSQLPLLAGEYVGAPRVLPGFSRTEIVFPTLAKSDPGDVGLIVKPLIADHVGLLLFLSLMVPPESLGRVEKQAPPNTLVEYMNGKVGTIPNTRMGEPIAEVLKRLWYGEMVSNGPVPQRSLLNNLIATKLYNIALLLQRRSKANLGIGALRQACDRHEAYEKAFMIQGLVSGFDLRKIKIVPKTSQVGDVLPTHSGPLTLPLSARWQSEDGLNWHDLAPFAGVEWLRDLLTLLDTVNRIQD